MMKYQLNKLNELAAGDQEFIETIVVAFLEEVPQDLNELKLAIGQGDFESIYQYAHKLKPNLDLLGMEFAKNSILTIENEAKGGRDINLIKSLMPDAANYVDEAIIELKKDFNL
ncbi:Hpt domain-containing protein [Zhouia spongiae]|uniref:Hpt domain-containing protein n=1 Tax=Zhouia spongiae TaxID=2202721 RepID=A0ABY3YN01_9FLAO|nr:Hpt domain-containing protein [Zhouia spongiae]UNY98886.1 Hpt domain-containing protein [Zhouia spongiae]